MIIFLGIAGSGKSLQAKLLAQSLNCDYLSLGELLRKNSAANDQDKLLKGELIPDSKVIPIISGVLDQIPRGKEFILDGFPRTLKQSKFLTTRFDPRDINIIHLVVESDVVISRLRLRNRQDDNVEAIEHRIKEYERSIQPIIEEFMNKSVNVFKIDGSGDIETVHEQIIKDLESFKRQ